MNTDIQKFESLITRYKLAETIPENIQKFALKSGNDNLLVILRKTGHYSTFFAAVLKLYHTLRGLGLNVTIIQTKIMFLIASLCLGTVLAAGAYKLRIYIPEIRPSRAVSVGELDVKNLSEDKLPHNSDTILNSSHVYRKKYDIAIANFIGDSSSSAISNTLYKKILRIRGGSGIVKLSDTDRNRVNRILSGSVRSIGNIKYITVKLISVKDSKILYVIHQEIESDDQVNTVCNKIAEAIAANI